MVKELYVAACMDKNRCAEPGDLKPCSFHSRRRTGTCELSARLFMRLAEMWRDVVGPRSLKAAPYAV